MTFFGGVLDDIIKHNTLAAARHCENCIFFSLTFRLLFQAREKVLLASSVYTVLVGLSLFSDRSVALFDFKMTNPPYVYTPPPNSSANNILTELK